MEIVIISVVALVAIVIVGIVLRNSLYSAKLKVENASAQIETQQQRRYDLIPNLVETVKAYASHEREVLEKLTEARAAAGRAATKGASVSDIEYANSSLKNAMAGINMVAENYPDLKASANFQQLQEELTTTENKIASANQAFNDAVYDYNNKVVAFPSNIIAGMLSFKEKDSFTVSDPAAKRPVKVDFS